MTGEENSLAALRELAETQRDPVGALRNLRTIKNAILGHDQRKESMVRHGLLPVLRSCLVQEQGPMTLTDHEDIRLQATEILGCIAGGGRTFLPALSANHLLTCLLNFLGPGRASLTLLRASLRTLNSWSRTWAMSAREHVTPKDSSFVDGSDIDSFASKIHHILRSAKTIDPSGEQIVRLTCKLIAQTTLNETSRSAMLENGVMDVLAEQLIQIDSAQGRARASHCTTFAAILDALSSIIAGSTYRTHCLVMSPILQQLYSVQIPDLERHKQQLNKDIHTPYNLLPDVPFHTSRQQSTSFPAPFPGTSRSQDRNDVPLTVAHGPMYPWLMYRLRQEQMPHIRLSTLRLLSRIHGLMRSPHTPVRQKHRHLLVIPLLVKLIRDIACSSDAPETDRAMADQLREEAPVVLADLVVNDTELQKAAVDAGALKFLFMILKKTFDNLPETVPIWTRPEDASATESESDISLGPRGPTSAFSHVMCVRAACLSALSATALLVKGEGSHKVLLNQSTVGCVINCLNLMPDVECEKQILVKYNTVPVVIAACTVLRGVAKDVSQLRTTFADAKLADPIMKLLQHPRRDVQLAATDLCINVISDICPVRQELLDADVLDILCSRARGTDLQMQISTMWALKHAMLGASENLRTKIMDGVGIDTVMHLMENGPDVPLSVEASIDGPLSPGHRIASPSDMDRVTSKSDPSTKGDIASDATMQDERVDLYKTVYKASELRTTLERETKLKAFLDDIKLREIEAAHNPARDVFLVQIQAFNLLQNLCLPSETGSMMRYLDSKVGAQRLLSVIRKTFQQANATCNGNGSRKAGDVYPAAQTTSSKLIVAAMGLLQAIAASSDQYKTLIVEQKDLLEAFMRLISHQDPTVRQVSVWVVTNLTLSDVQDATNAKHRAFELRVIGIEGKIRELADDENVDIRERTKSAIDQIDKLLNESARPR